MYEMFYINEYPIKIQVACKHCASKGYIDKNCNRCNGKGVHNKTKLIWKVQNKLYKIDKIDRDSNEGELRYWEDMSSYFEEKSKRMHFTKQDAQKECTMRNIQKYGVDFVKQYCF